MRMRFKSTLVLLFVLIVLCSCVGVGYCFYDDSTTSADIVVDGDITINYLNGKTFNLSGNNEINFSVTNNSSEEEYYYISFTDVYASGVVYELTSSDEVAITNDLKSDIISNQLEIKANETISYTVKFTTEDKSIYSGTIEVGVKANELNTFADVILNDNEVKDSPTTSIGNVALDNEGLIKSEDDSGVAYYFRGNVLNNNVTFADFSWKIVKINGDGSVKLVLNDVIDEVSKYYDTDYNFSNSVIKSTLNDWFNLYLTNYTDYIAYYKFCNDTVLESNNSTYIAYSRIITNKIPTFVCLGDTTSSLIGLLTTDEVMLAGAGTSANTSYYLYNEDIDTAYFTMSSGVLNGVYYPFSVNSDGSLTTGVSGLLLRGVRPVINIIKNAKVQGNGTSDNPYQIIIDE